MRLEEMTLQQKIGQMFVAGFPGGKPSDEFLDLIHRRSLGNVILFQHNIGKRKQVQDLNGDLQKEIVNATGSIPFITVDEEGGVVSRLPSGSTAMPSAMAFSEIGDPQLVYQGARTTAEELRNLGFNFNLAPVLDINSNPQNPVIGVRSYGETSQIVSTYAKMAVKGYLDGGILCSGKHFPGHGDTSIDSHLSLPLAHTSCEELNERELVPFRNLINDGIPALTIAHILVPALEPERIPCTLSKRVIQGLLREKLRFQGLIISDCMEMNAMKEYYGVEAGVAASIAAGVDLIFISHTPALVETSMREVTNALKDGRLSMERIDDAVSRILILKEKLSRMLKKHQNESYEEKEHLIFADQVLERTITSQMSHKFQLGSYPIFVGVKPSRTTIVSDMVEGEFDFSHEMQKTFGGSAVCISDDPDNQEIRNVLHLAEGKSSVILGTLNGHLHEGQRKMIRAVKSCKIPSAFVALRNPYDLKVSGEDSFGVVLYEYSPRILEKLKFCFE